MIWCIAWAGVATVVAVIEFVVACHFVDENDTLRRQRNYYMERYATEQGKRRD